MEGGEAGRRVRGAEFPEVGSVDKRDPLGLKEGDMVQAWPTDSGASHKDSGRLVGLSQDEVVMETTGRDGERGVRIHYPRTQFRIRKLEGEEAKL